MTSVIIGSGIAGVSFAEKYRALNPQDDIIILTQEQAGYYSRPLLSRGFSKQNIEQSIILQTFDQLRAQNIQVISAAEVTHIDRAQHSISYTQNTQSHTLNYHTLILATGSEAFIPPPWLPYRELFFSLNSFNDLQQLRQWRTGIQQQGQRPHWGIIGGGLIGCEVASDLAVAGDQVTLLHALDRLMERQLTTDDSAKLLGVLQQSGVDIRFNQAISAFSRNDQQVCVHSEPQQYFDAVLVSCGFKPRISLAQAAGLATGRGIQVNAYLQTIDPAIYALGDVAELPQGKLYAFILPIRAQATWLAQHLCGQHMQPWTATPFTPKAKVHGFEADHPQTLS